MGMERLIKEEDAIYYVTEADLIKYISQTAPMGWNECCDFVRENDITSEEGKAYWKRDNVFNDNPEWYNPEAIKWMRKFFEEHPYMNKVMIVFDD